MIRNLASGLAVLMVCGCGLAPARSLDSGTAEPPPDQGKDAGAPVPDGGTLDAGRTLPLTVTFLVPDAADGGSREVSTVLYSLPFWVRVTGAAPGESVSLSSKLQNYSAQGTFVASSTGEIDTARDAPVSGSYAGVDPEGLVWSMVPVPETIGNSFDVTFEAHASSQAATATATLHRPGMGTGTRSVPVSTSTVKGNFFKWQGTQKRPAVLVLGGSECNLNYTAFDASYVSTLGFDALAIDYCSSAHVISEVPIEAVTAAIDWLVAQPEVDATRIGVFGASRGGELALQLAALDPRVKAVVALVPSPYRWGDTDTGSKSAWSWRGSPLPIVPGTPGAQAVEETLPDGGSAYRFSPMFVDMLAAATPTEIQAATIPFAATSAQFLLVGAEDDGVWPSCPFVEQAWSMLEDAGHPAGHAADSRLCIAQAGHALGAPGWPTDQGYSFYNPALGGSMVMGGTVAGRGRGNRQFDSAWRQFFLSVLGNP